MPDRSQNIYKLPVIVRCAILAVPFIVATSSLLAQSAKVSQSSSPQANQSALAQINILANRVDILEKRLATLEQKVTNDELSSQLTPQTATPAGGEDPQKTSTAPGGLSKADQNLLAKMQKQIDQLENANKDEGGLVHHPDNSNSAHVVTAPFKVVDERGAAILEVEANSAGKGL